MKRLILQAVVCVLFSSHFVWAGFIDDFLLNTEHRMGDQGWCFLDIDRNGNFYVTFEDCFSACDSSFGYIMKFGPNGDKLLGPVRITPNNMWVEEGGMIAVSPSGRIAVCWGMTPKILTYPSHSYVVMLDTNLNVIKPIFRADTNTDSLQGPISNVTDLDMDDRGFFSVLWFQETDSISTPYKSYYQRYDSLGEPIGGNIMVETPECYPCDYTYIPGLGLSGNGKLAVAVDARMYAPHASHYPLIRVYDTTGNVVLNKKLVSCDYDSIYPSCGGIDSCIVGQDGDVAIQDNGNFMYVFGGCEEDQPDNAVYGRVFDSLGNPLSPIIIVNSAPSKAVIFQPTVITDGRGGYLVSWNDARNQNYTEGWRDQFLQRFDSLGNPVGINHRVNNIKCSRALDIMSFDIASDGEKVYIAWRDFREYQTWYSDIYAQVMDLDLVGTYMIGDVNFDQQISLADVIFSVNYLFKGNPLPEGDILVADVNGDCSVSLSDVIYMVNWVFGKGPPFVEGCLP